MAQQLRALGAFSQDPFRRLPTQQLQCWGNPISSGFHVPQTLTQCTYIYIQAGKHSGTLYKQQILNFRNHFKLKCINAALPIHYMSNLNSKPLAGEEENNPVSNTLLFCCYPTIQDTHSVKQLLKQVVTLSALQQCACLRNILSMSHLHQPLVNISTFL